MRVGIVAISHESNTFFNTPTTWEHFEQGGILTGDAIRRAYSAAHHEIGGFFQGLDEAGIESVPIFAAWAMPGGVVTAHTFEKLLAGMLVGLRAAGELDGVLVAPYGAAVAENTPDMDGAWLRELRSRVGPKLPVIGTLDLHANLSEEMIRATDALIGYRTNPHLDQRDRGVEAARLMVRVVRGEVHPTAAAAFPPLAINIERQHTSISPCRECYEALDDLLADKWVVANSLLLGFPYADVREMGSSVIVVTNNEPTLAQELANQFAEYLSLRRKDFVAQLLEPDAAIDQALAARDGACLLDMGDNVGGGAPGDGTLLLDTILRRGIRNAFACLTDPAAVEQVRQAGVGAQIQLTMGATSPESQGTPLMQRVRVRGLYDGAFSESQPRHGGHIHYDMGPTAVLQLDEGPTVMLASRRVAPFSLNQLTSCGVNPAAHQILIVKGVHAPIAAYAPLGRPMLRVNTPGVTTADMTRLDYHHRRRPLFPFEAE